MSGHAPDPETLRLIARVLTLHFQEGLLQAEIATGMNLSTAKVNRLIKQGRELGMVEFRIHSPYQRLFELERQMKERWNLEECVVVDAVTGNPETTLNLVGKAAAEHVQKMTSPGNVLAISGGKALSAVADNINLANRVECTVVPMTGGVQGQHYTDVNHLATRIADAMGGAARLLHAPLHADTTEERDMLVSVRTIREVLDRARNADIALLGIGSVQGEGATYYEAHPLSDTQRANLFEEGVRAEFLGHLIDGEGKLCESELNSRLVSLPLEQARTIPVRIGVASGANKVGPICAALNGGHLSTLFIDDGTAQQVLNNDLAIA